MKFRGGFTLLELMAAIVIMALAAGLILPGVAGADDASKCRSMVAKLRDLDRKARLLARSEGMLEVALDLDHRTFVLKVVHSGERLAIVAPEPGTSAVLRLTDDHHSIQFDRAGRSFDYEIEVTCGENVRTYRVVGATGSISEVVR